MTSAVKSAWRDFKSRLRSCRLLASLLRQKRRPNVMVAYDKRNISLTEICLRKQLINYASPAFPDFKNNSISWHTLMMHPPPVIVCKTHRKSVNLVLINTC